MVSLYVRGQIVTRQSGCAEATLRCDRDTCDAVVMRSGQTHSGQVLFSAPTQNIRLFVLAEMVMFALSELLGQSSAVSLAHGSRASIRPTRRYGAWLVAAVITLGYLAISVAMLWHMLPGDIGLLAGPTTWSGLTGV